EVLLFCIMLLTIAFFVAFAYTMLFRSPCRPAPRTCCRNARRIGLAALRDDCAALVHARHHSWQRARVCARIRRIWCHDHLCFERSEEHTSELQSRENLVCRLFHGKEKS